ncbi:hypothetical protein EVC02_061 [Rhizobium phage RHph_N17]|nr:hypothetical protein EVC02_061 [Rhizobium phage RHph_N17]
MLETKTEVYVPGFFDVARPFRWRDSTGQDWLPEEMETRHLFFTVCMIWNHHMPIKTHPHYKRYTFGPFHNERYLQTAIRMLLPVLINRKDLKPFMKTKLFMMANTFFENGKDLLLEGGFDA